MAADEQSIQGHVWLREINGRVDLCGRIDGAVVIVARQNEMTLINLIEDAASALRAMRNARPK